MLPSLKYLIPVWFALVLVGTAFVNAAPQGFLEGQLKIVSRTPVELDGENTARETSAATSETYASYPLIVLSRGERKQIARVTADAAGNYRVALPPGNYILDVEGRVPKRLRVKTQPFTVELNETAHVDMTIVTEFAAEVSTPQD